MVASVTTCSLDGVCLSAFQPLATVSQASRPVPELASTKSSGAPTEVSEPENALRALALAAAEPTLAVVFSVSGATRPTEVPAIVPFGAVCTTKSPP
ncbi:hypothetical protein B0E53_02286 [Micromonospora sp. MH33]|nr:hypothetical protein B0E53_02286 [Micromonospora sp. MH33]